MGTICRTRSFEGKRLCFYSCQKSGGGGQLPLCPLAPLPPVPMVLFLQQMVPFASLVVWWSPSSLMLCCHYYAMKRENQATTGPKTLWIRNLKSKNFTFLFVYKFRIWVINLGKISYSNVIYLFGHMYNSKTNLDSKGYLSNLLLCQIFVFWVRDFKLWLLAYFFILTKCAKFQQDWTKLILDIL